MEIMNSRSFSSDMLIGNKFRIKPGHAKVVAFPYTALSQMGLYAINTKLEITYLKYGGIQYEIQSELLQYPPNLNLWFRFGGCGFTEVNI